MNRIWLIFAVWVLSAATWARNGLQETELISLRVTSSDPSLIVVDRGEGDGLQIGDPVRIFLRRGGVQEATVVSVQMRSAVIEMLDTSIVPEPGTRGEVEIPSSRIGQPEANEPPLPGTQEEGAPAADELTPERPEAGADPRGDGWQPGMPLLAQVNAVRPERRKPFVTGRVYTTMDYIRSGQDNRTDFWARSGLGLTYGNPFGRGGRLNFDGEINHRSVLKPREDYVEDHTRLRLDRLSYAWGGTRFQRDRFEVGRFLQSGLPEFGVLDGLEWQRRDANGHRYGASVGYLPEPDGEQQTGHDLQFAGWYRWVSDDSERFTMTGGFQKTLHDMTSDRDLFLFKVQAEPWKDWSLRGSAWIDYYDSRDVLKSSGLDLTRTLLSLSRRLENGRGLDLRLSHYRFPETRRQVGNGPILAELKNDRAERLSVRSWRRSRRGTTTHVEAGVWSDENDTGGDLEFGFQLQDLLLNDSRTGLVLFGARGRFDTVGGLRVVLSRELKRGRWDVLYELAHHHQDGFSDDRDDLLQNRLRGSRLFPLRSGWTLSPYVEADYWDQELAWSFGFWLRRRF